LQRTATRQSASAYSPIGVLDQAKLSGMRGIIVASVMVVFTVLVGCGGPGEQSSSSNIPNRYLGLYSGPDGAAIGQRVRNGNFAFSVTKVDPPRKSIGDQTAEGKFVVAHLTVTNISKMPQQFWGFNQTLRDAAGRKYTYDIEATGALELEQDGDVDFSRSWLRPGRSQKYALVFDLPDCVQPTGIDLRYLPGSDGVTVKL